MKKITLTVLVLMTLSLCSCNDKRFLEFFPKDSNPGLITPGHDGLFD
jgi:hypothetical protein